MNMRSVLLACFALTLPVQAENLTQRLDIGGLGAEAVPYIVAAGNINDPLYSTPRGGLNDSVAGLLLQTAAGSFLCTGTLLPSGMDILTAAHCVTDVNGQFNLLGG